MMATATGGRCSTFCGPRSELITYFGAGHLFLGYDARGTIRIRCESVRAVRVAYVYYRIPPPDYTQNPERSSGHL